MPKLRAAALSHIGRVRRNNEDRAIWDEQRRIFGVADGVGGLPGGAEASQAAHDAVVKAFRELPEGAEPNLNAIVSQANRSVVARGLTVSPGTGIATTLTFACLINGQLRMAHLGDSRCYAWSRSRFFALSEDHTVESEARRKRELGEIVPYSPAERHAITRCLGHPGPIDPQLLVREVEIGDRYLFCTDGVTGLVRDAEIAAFVKRPEGPADILAGLIDLALKRGGTDNATAVLVIVDQL